jgi:uncharacterized protein YbjT (DUF2867 family)
MIVVTSAAGFSGQNVIRALARLGQPVRAFVRNEAQAASARAAGAAEAVVGDLRRPEDARAALAGARALYFICPRFSEDEPAMAATWVDAARSTGLSWFVYHGVAHPYLREMPHHWDKLQAQLIVERSGLPFAVLQPTNYMRNVTWAWTRLVAEGAYTLSYSADAPLTWVDADDVAEAAARVLTEGGHHGGVYELCGTEGGITRREVCAMLSRRLGHPIEAREAAWHAWRTLPRYQGWTEGQMKRLEAMFAYYGAHGMRAGNPRVLAMLLGRPATSYETFLDRLMALPEAQRQAVL